jgi:hypothetical protein
MTVEPGPAVDAQGLGQSDQRFAAARRIDSGVLRPHLGQGRIGEEWTEIHPALGDTSAARLLPSHPGFVEENLRALAAEQLRHP